MKTCGRLNKDGTCDELKKNDPLKLGGVCMFCKNDIAEICDRYKVGSP